MMPAARGPAWVRSTAVVDVAPQRGPAAERVVHRLGEAAVLQRLDPQRLQPCMQLSQLRRGLLLAVGAQRLALQTLLLGFGLDAIE